MGGRVAISLAFILCCSIGYAEEAVKIPLDSIWSYDRARREFEPELFLKLDTPEKRAEYSTPEKRQGILDKAHSSLTWQIEQAMNSEVLNESKDPDPMKGQPAPGFAVAGKDYKALQGVHAVVVGKQASQTKFSQNDEISAVFFSLMTVSPPRLLEVVRDETKIDLNYVVPSTGRLGIRHTLLVIPLGQLPPGKYEVKPNRTYAEEPKYNEQGAESYEKGIERIFVCPPFQFEVVADIPKREEEQKR